MATHKRFMCPVSGERRDLDACSTCVESAGGTRGRCGLMTVSGHIRDSAHIGKAIERRKKAEEVFEMNKSQPRTPRDVAIICDVFEAVHAVLNTLTNREREVISLRFGISRTSGRGSTFPASASARSRQEPSASCAIRRAFAAFSRPASGQKFPGVRNGVGAFLYF